MLYNDSTSWKETVNSEIESILSNHAWELIDLPRGNKPLGSKWIFKRKMKDDGTLTNIKQDLLSKVLYKKKVLIILTHIRQRQGLHQFGC